MYLNINLLFYSVTQFSQVSIVLQKFHIKVKTHSKRNAQCKCTVYVATQSQHCQCSVKYNQ